MLWSRRPDTYFSQLGPDGRRVDVYERPELCRGAVEFVATSEYMVRCLHHQVKLGLRRPSRFVSACDLLEPMQPGNHACDQHLSNMSTCMAQVQPPMRPTHLFLVDVAYAAIASGAAAAVCSAIHQTLDSLPGAAAVVCR
jgi:protein transport protein SEC24